MRGVALRTAWCGVQGEVGRQLREGEALARETGEHKHRGGWVGAICTGEATATGGVEKGQVGHWLGQSAEACSYQCCGSRQPHWALLRALTQQPSSGAGGRAAAAVGQRGAPSHHSWPASGLRLGLGSLGRSEVPTQQRLPHSKAHWFSRRTSSSCGGKISRADMAVVGELEKP